MAKPPRLVLEAYGELSLEPRQYQEGKNFKRFFFRMTKIKGVKNWYCSLEMKQNFGMRPLAATS